jgi:hypothetical protein
MKKESEWWPGWPAFPYLVLISSSFQFPSLQSPAGPRLLPTPSLVGARPVTGATAWAPSLLCTRSEARKRGAAIGLQLTNTNAFSCLALHRHALCQTGTVFRRSLPKSRNIKHRTEVLFVLSMPMLKMLPQEWLDYENSAASLSLCRRPHASNWTPSFARVGAVNGRADVAVSTGGASLKP